MSNSIDQEEVTLWIGGTSSLARTFFVNHELVFESVRRQTPKTKTWILTGLEEEAPHWVSGFNSSSSSVACSIEYWSLDLTVLNEADVIQRFSNPGGNQSRISSIVVGIRPLLFDAYIHTEKSDRMIQGLEKFLHVALQFCTSLRFVLHISSVASVDHLRCQQNANENDDSSLPPLSEFQAPYDRFKRQCEDVITRLCCSERNSPSSSSSKLQYCHLRLGAIFSDDIGCIQCSALDLQARVGAYLDLPIDCNSSVNVSKAIALLLYKASTTTTLSSRTNIQPVYYYTRPLLLPDPVPYGYYLEEYRKAYGIRRTSIWIPLWMVKTFVQAVHWLTLICNHWLPWKVPYLDAADYLLQVASREHSFDCRRFRSFVEDHNIQNDDDDGSRFDEEGILECFVRRRVYLNQQKHHTRFCKSSAL